MGDSLAGEDDWHDEVLEAPELLGDVVAADGVLEGEVEEVGVLSSTL